MKFTEHLSAHITPEWRKQYINYEEMKAILYAAVEQAPSAEVVEPEVLTRYFAKFDEHFFHYCDKELTKINTFFSEKLAEATRKYANLNSEMSTALEKDHLDKEGILKNRAGILRKNAVPARKVQELKLAFSEFYLSLILLQNYQNLNFTGFRKILKKHDKLLAVDIGAKWRIENVENAHFYTNKDIDRLIQDTENTVIRDLESGDRQKAMKRLRVPPLGEQQSPWTTFKVGLFSGSFIVLLVAVILSAIFHQGGEDWRIAFRLYRGPLLLVEFLFLMGLNVYGWRSSGVNHVLIFELDPRNHLSEQHLMELAAIFGVIWTLSVLGFLYSSSLSIPPYANPLILILIMLAFLFNPLRTFRHGARFWILRVMGRVILAPFCYVAFADFWVADQLNSLVPALIDFHYVVCFYITGHGNLMEAGVAGVKQAEEYEQLVFFPTQLCMLNTRQPSAVFAITLAFRQLRKVFSYLSFDISKCVAKSAAWRPFVACLPAWFRFAQCLRRYRDTKEAFPHLLNAGKYSTSFFVVLFSALNAIYAQQYKDSSESPFFYIWIAASIVSSCYAYTWDIKMDWGLFDKNAGENRFLREEIVYSSTGFYYFAIVEDFLLRFCWALSLSLTEMGYAHGDLMMTILSPLEVFRRFIWNYFRLENEHLNNCGKFRAVRDISVAPMDSSDQSQIINMMDQSDGVVNRKKKQKKKHQGGGGSTLVANINVAEEEHRLMVEGESTDDPDG